jgi:hypothetical protein
MLSAKALRLVDPIHSAPGTSVFAGSSLARSARFLELFLSYSTPLCGSPFQAWFSPAAGSLYRVLRKRKPFGGFPIAKENITKEQ